MINEHEAVELLYLVAGKHAYKDRASWTTHTEFKESYKKPCDSEYVQDHTLDKHDPKQAK